MPSQPSEPVRDIAALELRLTSERSQFALEDVTVRGIPYRCYHHAPHCLIDIYRKAAAAGTRVVAIDGDGKWTVSRLFAAAADLSALLSARFGVKKGARVALAVNDGPYWLAAFIAITGLNATAVLVPRPMNLKSCCTITRSQAAIFSDEAGGVIVTDFSHQHEWTPAGETKNFPWLCSEPDDEVLIAFTSGSTGIPKAVVITHRALITGLFNMMLAGTLAAATRRTRMPVRRPLPPCVMMLAPLSHISGYGQFLLMLLHSGALFFPASADVDGVTAEIAKNAVTSIAGLHLPLLRALSGATPDALQTLTSINIGGMEIPDEVVGEVADHLPHVWLGAGYGLTETNGSICAIGGEEMRLRPLSLGRILPTVEIEIRDGSRICDIGEAGEIWLRGAMVVQGYCDSPYFPSGWLATGDAGFLSADRHLHMLSRTADMEGSAAELTRRAYACPAVYDAAAVHRPDDAGIVLAVVPKRAWCEASLYADLTGAGSDFRIVTVTAIPRTERGKVDRTALLQQIGERLYG